MSLKNLPVLLLVLLCRVTFAQLMVARDTITVIENNYALKMPWNNGINFSNLSRIDLNFDGKKDVVAFDKLNQFSVGKFRCFLNNGNPGEIKYKGSPESAYAFPQVANWAVLLDYNCDGLEDIFCSTSAGIKVFKNVSTAPTLSFVLVKPLLYSDFNPGGTPSIGNLYASPVGVPGIADIDGDGDLDILTYSPLGVFVEYHKNMRVENNLHCDSLVFELTDGCWGKFSESSCIVNLNQCAVKQPWDSATVSQGEKVYHAGSCLTCIDSDADNDQDLVMGDISCNTVQYGHNGGSNGTPLITDTTRLYPNYPNKNNTTQIKLNNFPCTYYLDINNDGKKDLVATPNAPGSENAKSVWYYHNTSATGTVNFQFVKNNLFQDEMIEVGQNSYPVVFDFDADGKKDLLLGNWGYYSNNALKSQLTLYKNIGTLSQPAYSLITRDYANVSLQNLNNVMPTVGDVDGDNDIDICIGTSSGQIHWLENTGGQGNPCNFSAFHNNPFSFTTTSAAAAPQLFDIDGDGKQDLLIGGKNGRIAFYKNTSATSGTPTFSLMSNFFGGVDVKGNVNLFGIDGYATPFFYSENGNVKLLVGSVNGNIFHYAVPAAITNTFSLFTANTNFCNEGGQSTVCFEDLNNDNKRDLLVGNASGGLSFFSSWSPNVGLHEISAATLDRQVIVFPNPTSDQLNLRFEKLDVRNGEIIVYDIFGKEILKSRFNANNAGIDLHTCDKGVYFVKIAAVTEQQGSFNVIRKVIKD
ncbi:MAG: T9SS type A sorting domain-containing protein [Bacteroidota bacterium]